MQILWFPIELAQSYFSHSYSMQSLDALKEVMDGAGYGMMDNVRKALHYPHWLFSDDPTIKVLREASKIDDEEKRRTFLEQHYKPADHHAPVGCIEGDLQKHLR